MTLLRTGPRGAELHRIERDGAVVTVHALDPEGDADLVHSWVTQPVRRSGGWGR